MKVFYKTYYLTLLAPGTALAADYGTIAPTTRTSLKSMIAGIQNYLVGITGAAAMLFIIYGGYLYITSRGNKQQAEKAKKTLTYAIAGLILVILAELIFNILYNGLIGTFVGSGNI